MSQTPSNPSGSPSRQAPPSQSGMNEDFVDFEGDPTSINQIPRDSAQGTPRPAGGMHPQPGAPPAPNQFASASPSLSHIGGPPPQQYGTNPGHSLQGPPQGPQ